MEFNYKFNATGDYVSELNAYIDGLWAKANDMSRQERIDAVQRLTDVYIATLGKIPKTTQLDRLSTLLLREELADKNAHKVAHEEYPILSDHQLKRREQREADGRLSDNYGTDGRKHGAGKRNRKTNQLN